MSGSLIASAFGSTKGDLNVSTNWFTSDSASGTTFTNYAPSNKFNVDKLWVQTTVYAYDKNNKSVKNTSPKCTGTAALEGWSKTKATVKMSNIYKAKSIHTGGTTGYGSQTVTKSWKR